MYSGLGIVDYAAGSLTFGLSNPRCLTAMERAEARSKCRDVRGIGAYSLSPMTGRLQGLDPCALKDLPLCPDMTCLTPASALAVASCISRRYLGPDHQAWCGTLEAYAVAQLPFCSTAQLPALPNCATADHRAGIDYCLRYGAEGPDRDKNALCYMAMHDASYWNRARNIPACAGAPPPPAPPPAAPPPTTNICQQRELCWDGSEICLVDSFGPTGSVCPPKTGRTPPGLPPAPPPVFDQSPPPGPPAPPPVPPVIFDDQPLPPTVFDDAPPPDYQCLEQMQCWDGTVICVRDSSGPTGATCPEQPPSTRSASAVGIGSILLLLAAAGGGYYWYHRSK